MNNTKNSFLKMLKIYFQLRSTLIKFLNIKSIIVWKMKTKNLIKNRLGKSLTNSYLLIGKAHEDLLQSFIVRYASIEKINKDRSMSHLRFKNLFKVVMITDAIMQWSCYLKLEPNFCVMRTAWKDWKRIYKSNTNLQLKL